MPATAQIRVVAEIDRRCTGIISVRSASTAVIASVKLHPMKTDAANMVHAL